MLYALVPPFGTTLISRNPFEYHRYPLYHPRKQRALDLGPVWMRDVLGTSDDLKGLGQNARIERWVMTAVGAGGGRAQALTDEHVG